MRTENISTTLSCDCCGRTIDQPSFIINSAPPNYLNLFGKDICETCYRVVLKKVAIMEEDFLEVIDKNYKKNVPHLDFRKYTLGGPDFIGTSDIT